MPWNFTMSGVEHFPPPLCFLEIRIHTQPRGFIGIKSDFKSQVGFTIHQTLNPNQKQHTIE